MREREVLKELSAGRVAARSVIHAIPQRAEPEAVRQSTGGGLGTPAVSKAETLLIEDGLRHRSSCLLN